MALKVDSLKPAELRTLAYGELVGILDELFGEMKRLSELKCEAIDLRRSAKVSAIQRGLNPQKSEAYVNAQASLDQCSASIQARKLQLSAVQTLVNSLPVRC